ncbi:ribonuclease R family protein [Roseiconus lacunae]|uniref:Ribonuclease R n=1 Tax=Roseiconus lacunae TaxID=2605694 RepID=A0ABT7PIW4_9BACT|nr:VacB/RNase II family 3'-5' exoribonuclease [Roseiconus lacunae]MCD0458549.1 VacB/RNase II family 3'-5' exoribonuclease [Roseiconus lacunae]MDM4016437.1 VacB/RNase II family 3'-5' exoribonuclease [Roseiconus lacunae]WRQ51962.1 VacB/RNase II family 3'-5' exoribonuclease [Stieleria sp. HD01]
MEISQELVDRVMRLVVSPDYRPSKPKQIAAALDLPPDEYRELRRTIKQLVLEGRLIYGSNHLVISTGAIGGPQDRIRGVFRMAAGGAFGFVRPGDSGDGAATDDLFIPPGKTGGALEGDLVEVKVRPGRRGENEGSVHQILERARRQFTGTFVFDGNKPAVYLDGTPHEDPVYIGDIQGLPLEANDKVFVEVVRFPGEAGKGGEAVLLERLGSNKNPNIDTLTIMRQYALPDHFAEDIIDEARQRADEFNGGAIPDDRVDFTDQLTLTIDPYDARDFDDAISLSRNEKGHWRLLIHIADVGYFVHPGGKIDEEARRRATSVYLPDRVIPMIPEIISNHLASLQPDQVRLAKTVEIEMTDAGVVVHSEVHNAVIRSDKRLHYGIVDQFLEDPQRYREPWGDAVCDMLADMHSLAMTLRQRRLKGGAITMDMPDVKLDLDRNGKVKGAHRTVNTESHQVIEEFMLAANQAVATWLDDQGYNFLHRIHPPPDRRKLRQLSMFIRDLGIGVDSVESRFEIQHVIDQVAQTPLEDAVNFAVLRSMSKAIYGPQTEGHYALDMEHYCHFTSPIRRYPDLTVHRLIDRLRKGEKTPDDSMGTLVNLGHHCSDQERNAAQAERELTELKLLHFMKKHIGQSMPAVITRVFSDGFLARCTKLPIDGYVGIDQLPNDQYRFERRGQMLVGFKAHQRYRLGDQLTVKITKVDLIGRQLFLHPEKNHSVGAGKPNERQSKSSKSKRQKHQPRGRSKKSKRGKRR